MASAEASGNFIAGQPIQVASQITDQSASNITKVDLLGHEIQDSVPPNYLHVGAPEAPSNRDHVSAANDLENGLSLEEAIAAIANEVLNRAP